MLHRPLRRPLAVVALLSLVDYGLWNWSRGASLDTLALLAGLSLTLLLIALAWLVVLGAARFLTDAPARRAARAANAGRRPASGARRVRRRTVAATAAHDRRAGAAAGAAEATPAASRSKLAA